MLPELKNKALKVGVLSVFFLFFLLLCCQCNFPFSVTIFFFIVLEVLKFQHLFSPVKKFS